MTPEQAEQHRRHHERAVKAAVEAHAGGRHALALDFYEEALAHALALEDRPRVHAARINISGCLLGLGEHARAREGLAAIILESDSPLHISTAAAQLAEALMHEGRLEKATHYLRLAGDQARLAGDAQREGWVLTVQGHVGIVQGQYDEAIESYRRSLEIFKATSGTAKDEHGKLPGWTARNLATRLDNLGYAQVLAQRLTEGVRTLHEALRVARRLGNERLLAEIEKDIAFGFLLAAKNTAAERHAVVALRLAKEHGFRTVLQSSYYLLMELAVRDGRSSDFDRWFDQLQALLPDVRLSRDFFRIFDLSDVVNLKEF